MLVDPTNLAGVVALLAAAPSLLISDQFTYVLTTPGSVRELLSVMSEDERRLLSEDNLEDFDELDQVSEYVDAITEGRKPEFDVRLAIAFTILGAGMLWPFNSFITANEFFGKMFRSDRWILSIYSPAITFLFTLTNLCSATYFTKTVKSADLNARIASSTITTTVAFVLLAVFTTAKLKAVPYFIILMFIVAASGISTGALQNGVFALVGNYDPRCVQFVMIGQGIAGVTPAILSIVVAILEENPGKSASKRAFTYFLSSSLVLASAYFAHLYLRSRSDTPKTLVEGGDQQQARTGQDFSEYAKFLHQYHPWTIFLTFTMTLAIFPSVTASVLSVLPTEEGIPFKDLPKLLQPAIFIPVGFLLWNSGDLLGRCLSVLPILSFDHPRYLFTASVLRFLWIPIVFLFNVRGSGAIVKSDLLFFIFMLLFGLSNGYLGSLVMSAAIKQAQPQDKRGMGAFMSFVLCSGLVAGSLFSFIF